MIPVRLPDSQFAQIRRMVCLAIAASYYRKGDGRLIDLAKELEDYVTGEDEA